MHVGKPERYDVMRSGIIYKCIEAKCSGTDWRYMQYRFLPVFSMENPIGIPLEATSWQPSRDLKRISLLDLGMMRLAFDSFIKEWAKDKTSDSEADER